MYFKSNYYTNHENLKLDDKIKLLKLLVNALFNFCLKVILSVPYLIKDVIFYTTITLKSKSLIGMCIIDCSPTKEFPYITCKINFMRINKFTT